MAKVLVVPMTEFHGYRCVIIFRFLLTAPY